MKRICEMLLRLYPLDYRKAFGAEMLTVSAQRARDRRTRGRVAFVRFVLAEITDFAVGAAVQWCAKIAPYRPAAVGATAGRLSAPDEMTEAENRVKTAIDRMVDAIATHQFEKARFHSEEERKARELCIACDSNTILPAKPGSSAIFCFG